jgi:hypothetical protein
VVRANNRLNPRRLPIRNAPSLLVTGHASAGFEVVSERRVGETEPQEEMLMGTSGCRAPGPVTSFLFIRYRLQSFKVGAEIPHQAWKDSHHMMSDSFSN